MIEMSCVRSLAHGQDNTSGIISLKTQRKLLRTKKNNCGLLLCKFYSALYFVPFGCLLEESKDGYLCL